MWALQYNSETGKVDKNYQIWEDGLPVIAFGEDEQGEIYYLVESSIGENIYRLERDWMTNHPFLRQSRYELKKSPWIF